MRVLIGVLVAAVMLAPGPAVAGTLHGDSLVLAGTTPGRLGFAHVVPGSLSLRSTYDPAAAGLITYETGRDYVLDAEKGEIARTADSRIPDFATNVLYGQQDFDHSKFPGYGNGKFFVFADYESPDVTPLAASVDASSVLAGAAKKLRAGGPFKVITYGDSISAGGEATAQALRFDERFAAHLRAQFPKAEITVENGATGGDSTVQGLARLEEKVLTRKPDLVLVGFGMNDHNKNGVPEQAFEDNLVSIATQIREKTGADVLMFSAFPPNPAWKHSSHRMDVYAAATARAATRSHAAFADVFAVWQKVLARKDISSLLGNNINHPNDFGHALYAEALNAVQFVKP